MMTVSVNEARKQLADLINAVTQGQQVAISRRGKPVAKLSAIAAGKRPQLPDLAQFRKSLGKATSKPAATIRRLRDEERY